VGNWLPTVIQTPNTAKKGNRIKYEDTHNKVEEKWTGNPWKNK
jgi:hypothetical protein